LNNLFKTFGKVQVSSSAGGMTDYGVMLLLTEFFNVYYVLSIVIGGLIGAVVNFSINRYWTFKATGNRKREQLPKFITVVVGSITLKSGGTWLMTEFLHLDYRISRIIVDGIVAICWNFTLQKLWVFKK
jgi:putative flippase GtrA